jgi:hypothetical protein
MLHSSSHVGDAEVHTLQRVLDAAGPSSQKNQDDSSFSENGAARALCMLKTTGRIDLESFCDPAGVVDSQLFAAGIRLAVSPNEGLSAAACKLQLPRKAESRANAGSE